MRQGGDRFAVKRHEGLSTQGFGAACYSFGHLDDVFQVGPVPGRIYDGLGGVLHHLTEVIQVRNGLGDIEGYTHAHQEVDMFQSIHQLGDVRDVLEKGLPAFPGISIDDKGRVGAGAVVPLAAFQFHGGIALPVAEHDPAGRAADGPLDQVRWNVNTLSVHPATDLFEQVTDLRDEHVHSGPA